MTQKLFNWQLNVQADSGNADSAGTVTLAASLLDESTDLWQVWLTAPQGFSGRLALRQTWQIQQSAQTERAPWFLLPGFFYGQGRDDDSLAYPALGPGDGSDWRAPAWDFALDRMAMPLALTYVKDAEEGQQWRGVDWQPHYDILDPSGEIIAGSPAIWGESEPQIGVGIAYQSDEVALSLNIPANESPASPRA